MKFAFHAVVAMVAVATIVTVVSVQAQAFGLPSIGGGGGSAVDIDGMVNQNETLVKRYQKALRNLLEAQSLLADALGLKEAAERAAAGAELLGSGNVLDADALKRETQVTEENSALIAKKLSDGVVLDDVSKQKFGKALPFYARGTYEAAMIAPEAGDYASKVSTSLGQLSTDPMGLLKLRSGTATGVYIASNLPGLIKKWYGDTETLVTFGRKNDIDVSEATDVMDDIAL